jgi:hypothetical protein
MSEEAFRSKLSEALGLELVLRAEVERLTADNKQLRAALMKIREADFAWLNEIVDPVLGEQGKG